jgi:TonB family protein
MNAMINYLLEVNVGLLLFMFVYWAVLRNETQFTLKRAYLLFALLGSLIFPLFHFNVTASTQVIPSIGKLIPTYWLPEIIINGNGSVVTTKASTSLSVWTMTELVYLFAFIALTALFLYRIISIAQLFATSFTYRWRNYVVTETDEAKPTFSFFHFILIGQANQLDKKEKEEILIHESIHVQKLHSLDILLVNVVGIVCWFNPIVRVYKKALVQLHEFEADARSVENKDVDTYCGLLAKVALQSADFPLANHFNNSLTFKRINMMKTIKHKIQNWKVAALVAVIPTFFFVVACQEQFKNEKEIQVNKASLPKEVVAQLNRLRLESPKSNFIVLEKNGEELDEYKKGNPNAIILFFTFGPTHFAIVEPNGIFERIPKNEREVFSVVDEVATPVFGIEAFYENLSYTIQYPENARKNGIEGKVYVEFVVQTDGTISDVKLIRGIDNEIDTEALRAFYQLDHKWNPAIHQNHLVKMKMVLPIVFSLNGYTSSNTDPLETSFRNIEFAFGYDKELNSNKKHLIEGIVQWNQGILPRAKIQVKNSKDGAYSDLEGKFFLETSHESGTLMFSFPGFKTTEVSF